MGMIHEGGPHVTDETVTEILLQKNMLKTQQLFTYVNDCDDCWKKLVEIKNKILTARKAELKSARLIIITLAVLTMPTMFLVWKHIQTRHFLLAFTGGIIVLAIYAMIINIFYKRVLPIKKWIGLLKSIPEPQTIDNDSIIVSVPCQNYGPNTKTIIIKD